MNRLVSVIIIAYNNLFYLKQCLNSIFTNSYQPNEIILVDNSTNDDIKNWINKTKAVYDHYQNNQGFIYIYNNENKGYAGGCNQGIKKAKGDYFAFLNSDIIVGNFWLKRLIYHLDNDQQAGLVGPMGKGIGGEQNYEFIYKEPGYKQPVLGNLNSLSDYLFQCYRYNYTESKFIIGCCFLTKRSIVEKIGSLDEKLFMSADDFDYSLRSRLTGYKLYVAEDVIVHHFDHKSFTTIAKEQQDRYVNEGWKAFQEKWASLLSKYSMDDLFYNKRKIYFTGLVKGRRNSILGDF